MSHAAALPGGETGVETEVCYTTVYSKKDPPKSFGNSRDKSEVSHNCEQSEHLLLPVFGQQSVRSIMG